MPTKKSVKSTKKTTKKPIKKGSKPKLKPKGKIPPKVLKYLEKAGVKHEILEHKTVYTAIDAAMTMKKKLDEIAKSLLVKADKDYYLIILPADHNLDFNKLKKVINKELGLKIKVIKIPGEKIMENTLKVKQGALTAFGNLHKVGVVVENKLEKAKKAVFSVGSHNHSVEMAVKDFIKMEGAKTGSFGIKKKVKKQATMKPNKAVKKKISIKKQTTKKK